MDESLALVHRYFDGVWNKGHLTVADDLMTPPLATAFKRSAEQFRAAFPDLRATVDDAFSAGDRVVVRTTIRGTHLAPLTFAGHTFEPTGKELTFTGIEIFRVEAGRLVEHWEEGNYLGALEQLGTVSVQHPAPHAARGNWVRGAGWVGAIAVIAVVAWLNSSRDSSPVRATEPETEHYVLCNDALERRRAAENALATAPPSPGGDTASYAIAKSGWDEARRTAQESFGGIA
jgi:predicted ester cyclase